MIVVDGDV